MSCEISSTTPTLCIAWMSGVRPFSSSFTQLICADWASASVITNIFLALAALYRSIFAVKHEMSSNEVVDLTSGSTSASLVESVSELSDELPLTGRTVMPKQTHYSTSILLYALSNDCAQIFKQHGVNRVHTQYTQLNYFFYLLNNNKIRFNVNICIGFTINLLK